MINRGHIKSGLKIIRFILKNFLIFFIFFLSLYLSEGLRFEGEYLGFDEIAFIMIYFELSIPLLFIGFFTGRNISKKVGLAFALSYLTMMLAYEIINKPYPLPTFFIYEKGYAFKILSVLYVAYFGTLFAWIGSLVGERIRPKIHKEYLTLDLKKGFLATYIFYIILLWWLKL